MITDRELVYEPESIRADAELKKHPFGRWEIDAIIGNERLSIPIYNIREERDKDVIAQRIAACEPFVFHGWGVEGLGQFALNTRWGHPVQELVFNRGKKAENRERGVTEVPIFLPPRVQMQLMDPRAIEPSMRRIFTDRQLLEASWEGPTAHHKILPVRSGLTVHPELIRTPDSWQRDPKYANKPEFWVDYPTISAMWMPDKDWNDIVNRVELFNNNGVVACSSMNKTGQPPKWDTEGLPQFIIDHKEFPADFGIRDPLSEDFAINAESSHPQFRPAFVGEEPGWNVYRRGALDAQDFAQALGGEFPIRTPGNVPLESIRLASRSERHADLNLSQRHFDLRDRVNEDYDRRHPHKQRPIVVYLGGVFHRKDLQTTS